MIDVTEAVDELVRKMVWKTDEELGAPWRWGDYDEEGLRFALLMTHHELRDLDVRLAAERPPRTQAQTILAQYHEAYRDMDAVLATVRSPDLDVPPAPGVWPVRDVLVHVFRAEHGFLARLRYAFDHRMPERWDDEEERRFLTYRAERYHVPDDALSGTVESVRARLGAVHRRALEELGGLTDDQLGLRTWFWESTPMTVRFRLHRFEGHLRQHTVQLDKTLAGIGRPPTEAHRLIRDLYGALAAVESERAPADALRAEFASTIARRVSEIAG